MNAMVHLALICAGISLMTVSFLVADQKPYIAVILAYAAGTIQMMPS